MLSAHSAEPPPNEVIAAVDAVADSLGDTDLSDDALFAADLDAEVLARQVRATVPHLPTEAGLSCGAERLYRFALDQSCRLDAPAGTDRDEDFRSRYVDLVAAKLE